MYLLIECYRENKGNNPQRCMYHKEPGKLQRRMVEMSVIYTLSQNTFVKTILAAS